MTTKKGEGRVGLGQKQILRLRQRMTSDLGQRMTSRSGAKDDKRSGAKDDKPIWGSRSSRFWLYTLVCAK
jgi:uncharacterized protein with von Willebrand factor type A (vWA) domain